MTRDQDRIRWALCRALYAAGSPGLRQDRLVVAFGPATLTGLEELATVKYAKRKPYSRWAITIPGEKAVLAPYTDPLIGAPV
jgi:hypothetical protein